MTDAEREAYLRGARDMYREMQRRISNMAACDAFKTMTHDLESGVWPPKEAQDGK